MAATIYAIPGCDDLVPDDSEEDARAWRAEVGAVDLGQITPADAVMLDCTKETATQDLAIIDRARHSTLDPQEVGVGVFAAQRGCTGIACRSITCGLSGHERNGWSPNGPQAVGTYWRASERGARL